MEKEVREETAGWRDAIRISAHKFDLDSCVLSNCGSNYVLHTHTSAFVLCQNAHRAHTDRNPQSTLLVADWSYRERGRKCWLMYTSADGLQCFLLNEPPSKPTACCNNEPYGMNEPFMVFLLSFGQAWRALKSFLFVCFLQIICQQNEISAKDGSYTTSNMLICLQPQLWRQQAPAAHSFPYVDFDCHLLGKAWNTRNDGKLQEETNLSFFFYLLSLHRDMVLIVGIIRRVQCFIQSWLI